ncbi:hypothetical protein ACLOJK_016692 [Asimina triloba]
MASLRLRRSLVFSSSLLKYRPFSSIPLSNPDHHHHKSISSPPSLRSPHSLPPHSSLIQSLSFRFSSLSSSRRPNDADNEKISPDEILFPGCDYNHWLITMDFPKDPKPTPEEMVETYVQTLAKVVGSVEEAKKSMYACSTTTYTGFQAVMTEEMSEKFRGLPGVVFILPDSYIDPVNKEYGGDKYINGTIIPRPPPVQYGRSQGRYGDRNRNYDRARYDRPRDPMPAQQWNAPPNQGPVHMQQGNAPANQGSMHMQQGSAPPNQGSMHMQQGSAPPNQGSMHMQQGNAPPNQGSMHMQGNFPQSQNYVRGDGRNFAPSQNYGPPGQSDGRGYGPPPGRDSSPAGERRDFSPSGNRDYAFGGRDNYQGDRRPMPSYQNYNQGAPGNYVNQEHRDFSQGAPERGDYRNAGPSGDGEYRQGAGSGNGQSYTGTGDGQRFSQADYREGMEGDSRDFSPMGRRGTGQQMGSFTSVSWSGLGIEADGFAPCRVPGTLNRKSI